METPKFNTYNIENTNQPLLGKSDIPPPQKCTERGGYLLHRLFLYIFGHSNNQTNGLFVVKIIPLGSKIRHQVDFDLPEFDFQPQMGLNTPKLTKRIQKQIRKKV